MKPGMDCSPSCGPTVGSRSVEGGGVAGDSCDGDAWVECGGESGDGSSAGAAFGSDAGGIDLGTGEEVVDGAHGVPDEVFGDGFADEDGLESGFTVLAGGARGEGLAGVRGVGVLEALALTDGVVGEDGEAVAGEGGGEGIVACLAGGRVAGCHEDGGEFGAFFSVGDIEERGHVEAGLAVEEDLLDAEAVGLRGAEDLGVERGLGGEGADEGEDLFADFGLAGEGLGLCVDGGDNYAAVGVVFGGDGVEIVGEREAAGVRGGVGVGADQTCCCGAICGRRGGLRVGDGRKCGGEQRCDEDVFAHGYAFLHPLGIGVKVGPL